MQNLAVSALIFTLLEFWRPFYFLTDDNLNGGYPLFTGIGWRLAAEKSPFVSDYLFGGNYSLLRDATFFVWHPVYLLSSLLANTPAHLWIMEIPAFFFLMLATAGFVCLACSFRDELSLGLGNGWLTFYALSFTYSMIVLTTGSSWLDFLGDHSALPWLALGIWQKSWHRGLALVTLFSLHEILGGHPTATISNSICLSLFAVGIAFYRRSFLPLFSWGAGSILAVMILSPLLVPMLRGFSDSVRAEGLALNSINAHAVPALLFPFSYFFSTFAVFMPGNYRFGMTPVYYSTAFVSCAAAWALVPALLSRARWRFLEILCLGLALLLAVMIIRPTWIGEIMLRVPLLRSMRWPFREILQFQFFLHLFLVLRPRGGSPCFQRWITLTGSLFFLLPLPYLEAPSFNTNWIDRALVLSGGERQYWDRVRPLIGPDGCIAAVADLQLIEARWKDTPFSLLGAYNYPILARVRTVTGYSLTPPRQQLYVQVRSPFYLGIYDTGQMNEIFRERPQVKCIVLESLDPLRIVLHSATDPDIDLTPFIPMDKLPKVEKSVPEE